MRETMSEQKKEMSVTERKRVQNMKNLIIVLLFSAIIIPCAVCAILMVKLSFLGQSVGQLTEEVEKLKVQVEEWRSAAEDVKPQATDTDVDSSVSVEKEDTFEETMADIQQSEAIDSEEASNQEIESEAAEEARRKVYLTFDDGPGIYTEEILDILDRYEVKATFFVVGKEEAASKEALREIVERGHSLGMHSYSHKYSEVYASVEDFAADFEKLRNYLYEVTGVWSDIYRFPGGSSNAVSDIDMREFVAYLEEEGVTFFDWNVSSGDGGSVVLSAEQILENCIDGVKNFKEATILLHESADKKTTVEALPLIIEKILAIEDTVILPITEDTKPVQHITG